MGRFCSEEEIKTMALFLLAKQRHEGKGFNVAGWELSKLKDDHSVRAPHCTLDWMWRHGYLRMHENDAGGYSITALNHKRLGDVIALEV